MSDGKRKDDYRKDILGGTTRLVDYNMLHVYYVVPEQLVVKHYMYS